MPSNLDIDTLLPHRCPLIGDRWLTHATGGERPLIDPNTGQAVAMTRLAGAHEVRLAVPVAKSAQRIWYALRPDERRDALLRWVHLIEAAEQELRMIAALESGVPLSVNMVPLALSWLRYYAGWSDRITGDASEGFPARGFNFTRKEPYGVVGVIIPWNGPLVAISMTCMPALAAGNSVVVKPPSQTPYIALKLGELALQAGLPPGLFCVLPGDAEAGAALSAHPGIGKVCFTGGGEVAKQVLQSASQTLKPVFLELGGKSANLLFNDADLDAALPKSLYSCMLTSGQGCVLPTRLLVQDGIYDEVVQRLSAAVPHLTLGHSYLPESVLGPVISEGSAARILSMVDRASAEGRARLLCGGRRATGQLAQGYFVEPTVMVDVAPDSLIAREEVFGPVLSVLRFSDEAQAVQIANDTWSGLGAYLHTRDLDRALKVSSELEAGYVTINSYPAMNPGAPFGGFKQSGYGRVGGREGLEEYLQTKNVFVGAA